MSDNWRNEPLTKGELYDALKETAEKIEKGLNAVLSAMDPGKNSRVLVRLFQKAINDSLNMIADKIAH